MRLAITTPHDTPHDTTPHTNHTTPHHITGQCCFWDQQCKPQCENTGSSKCNVVRPPCSVPGCGFCSPTNSSQCVGCWAGYVLNVDTQRCQCAPGYYGTTSCSKCASGTVSYGGKLPTTACFTCPTGRVPNKAQSECVGECWLCCSAWLCWLSWCCAFYCYCCMLVHKT